MLKEYKQLDESNIMMNNQLIQLIMYMKYMKYHVLLQHDYD